MPRRRPRRRPGLTLIEVLLALAILLLSLAAIGQLVDIGGERGVEAQFHVRGTRLAQAKLAECEAGVLDPKNPSNGTFDGDDAAWSYTIDSSPEAATNLYRVTVTVTRDHRGKPFTISLSQLLIDPDTLGSASQAERPTQADVDAAANEASGGMMP